MLLGNKHAHQHGAVLLHNTAMVATGAQTKLFMSVTDVRSVSSLRIWRCQAGACMPLQSSLASSPSAACAGQLAVHGDRYLQRVQPHAYITQQACPARGQGAAGISQGEAGHPQRQRSAPRCSRSVTSSRIRRPGELSAAAAAAASPYAFMPAARHMQGSAHITCPGQDCCSPPLLSSKPACQRGSTAGLLLQLAYSTPPLA